ncbi:MAG: hypothetical protein IAB19_01785 [Proteobacteria bacterium]|uniref:Protein kinase domain-containing protein n=1 Tax=Candidatus Avisuccinivibrio stercorigallinarum TaxID=2840704 RepID=A0A9D9DBK1_9GAMM|nr:hypothetical protein [Candidatus Avisuccinivibrio stercorigallinarum]
MDKIFETALTIKAGGREKNLQGLKIIGQGNERICLLDPHEPEVVYKLSLKKRSRQSRREIVYFELLKRRQVPFTHIPEYYGAFKAGDYIGLIQEHLGNNAQYLMNSLEDELRGRGQCGISEEQLQSAFEELKAYLLEYNVLPSDLLVHNVLVKKKRSDGSLSLYIIDGFGSHNFIPLNNYSRTLGRRTILHQCRKLASSVQDIGRGSIILRP